MQKMKIKAADGLQVRDPETLEPLAVEGEQKPLNTYWQRRLAEGDVVEVTAPSEPSEPTSHSKRRKS